tara:strand:+ start:4536 stop:5474 length:939 start_codon:yes stop_codon:yes gene_type:complete
MSERINLYTLIHDLSGQYDYIAIGDTNHRDESVRALRGDLGLFRVAKNAGYDAFTLENPPEDYLVNDVVAAQIDAVPGRDAQAFFYESVEKGGDPVDLVGAFAAKAFDMTAIYPDPRYSPRFNVELTKAYDVIAQAPEVACQDVFLQAHWNAEPQAADYFQEEVRKGDDVIASRTAELSAGRALIVYGNGHFTGQNDLNERLGGDNVVHIAAIASRQSGYDFYSDSPGEAIDAPDYLYVIDEDAVIPFALENPDVRAIIDNYTSNTIENLDQESFDSCTQALPDDLRGHAVTQDEYDQARQNAALAPPLIPK